MTARLNALPDAGTDHLQPAAWARANRHLLRKALGEFAHEKLLQPRLLGPDTWEVRSDDGHTRYEFRAELLPLNHWLIAAESIVRERNGLLLPLDALQFMIELRQQLLLQDHVIALYLDEISSTLYGSAWKLRNRTTPVELLIDADFQTVEGAMTEGHPCFVANNGRLGFTAQDYSHYAPEAGRPFPVVWIAVDRERATLSLSSTLHYEQLLDEELGSSLRRRFEDHVRELGRSPDAYWFMPVHPWQWQNKLAMAFAADIARQHIIFLGYSDDVYLAQQSIRTLYNHSAPHKRYVKTALSILNMGFMRGLSPYYMLATPAINDWVHEQVEQDPWLQKHGFHILREVAAIGYRNPYYEAAISENNGWKKMLAALWRECPHTHTGPQERLMTMTALLHVDANGQALVSALIQASGLSAARWVQDYLEAYFSPLLHCFYQHDMIFMPHGENLIMVLQNHRPLRMLMKDIAEEVAVLNPAAPLPEVAQRISTEIPDDMKTLCLFIDVFDGYLRHLAALLHEHSGFAAGRFWQAVARCVQRYQNEHPQLAARFRRYDLFADDFAHSCLNRLQMANNQHMLNLQDPASGLQMAGRLANPLAQWRDVDLLAGGGWLS